MAEESSFKEANKKLREKLDQYEKAFKNLTMKEMADSAARSLALEQIDENPIRPKLKIKPKRDTVIPGKGGKGNYTPEGIRKMPTISREMARGGEVKKYMGGGSVHKKKNKMATTRGWGASRKT